MYDDLADDDTEVVFRDVVFLMLAAFVAIVILLLAHINPPTKTETTDKNPGNLMIEIRWPDDIDVDVDLWVMSPGDKPVGYKRKNGKVFDLLRDDLGRSSDITKLNYEFAYSRGAPEGEYVINVHMYNRKNHPDPVDIYVSVAIDSPITRKIVKILDKPVVLSKQSEELTVSRFRLDDKARLITGSINDLPMKLRGVQ